MALPPLASTDDLAEFLGEDIDDGDPRAERLIHMASTLVRTHTGRTGVDDWTDLSEVPDDVNTVTILVSARLWTNPENVSQQSETLGTFTQSRSFRADGLYLTGVEKAMLAHYDAKPGIWAQPTTRGDVASENGTLYAPVAGGSDPIPMIDLQEFPS